MITKAEKDRLLGKAEEMVAQAGGPLLAQDQFNELVREYQAATGINRERARHWIAKAIRRARDPKRKEENMAEDKEVVIRPDTGKLGPGERQDEVGGRSVIVRDADEDEE